MLSKEYLDKAGGSALVNQLITPGLSLEAGPIYLTSFYERAEGAGREYFSQVGAEAGDVIILVSTSGRNAFSIEMGMAAWQAKVVRSLFEPVVGAVLLALNNIRVDIDDHIIQAVEQSSFQFPACRTAN